MLQVLRRCRLLALTLLLAAPGLGGTWLPVVHPCPVDAPWLAAADAGGHHGADGAHHSAAPADSSSDAACHCIGVCETASTLLVPIAAAPTVRVASLADVAAAPAPAADAPAQRPLDRHPPATAPPFVS